MKTATSSKSMPEKKKKPIPNCKNSITKGNSRAAQNRKIRRDALREELKARNYIGQLSEIEQRLNP